MLLGSRGGPLSPPSEPRVPELPELLWDESQKGSPAMTVSTKLNEISMGSVLGRMEVFWIKILLNVQFEHMGSFFLYLLICSFFLQQQKFWERVDNPMLSEVRSLDLSSKEPGPPFRIFGSKKG